MVFLVELDDAKAFRKASFVTSSVRTDLSFSLRTDVPLPEYIVGIRFSKGVSTNKVMRCKFVTNLGRWSPWFGQATSIERFDEVYATPNGFAISEARAQDGAVNISVKKAPKCRPKRRRSLLGLALSTKQNLTLASANHPSPLHQVRSGDLRKKLPAPLPPLFSSKPSLLRLLTEDNDPVAIFASLSHRGKSFDASLLDLMLLNEPGDSLARLACEVSPILRTSVTKLLIRSSSSSMSLARLALTPCFHRGGRSMMQLITDDEALDNYEHPSLMRMMLFQEDKKDSILRLLMLRNPKLGSSITDLILQEQDSWRPSLARLLLMDNVETGRLSRFLADSPEGRSSLAKFLFAGGKNSVTRKTLLGEREGEHSILRLLLQRPSTRGDSVVEALARKPPGSNRTLFEMMVFDDELGVNLGRIVFETTCRMKNGLLETFSNADLPPSLIESESVLSDKGSTLAHFFLSGEQQNRFSMMRALLVGEVAGEDATRTSVLRLMIEADVNNQNPLLMVVMDEFRRLFAMQKQTKSKQLQPHEFLPLLMKMSAALKARGKDFAARWKTAWQFVSDKVKESSTASSPCTAEWRKLAPHWSALCVAIGRKRWSQVLVRLSRIGIRLDKGHGNRFMISQRAASKVAKAGVATYFGISKGIVSAVSMAVSPLPIASNVLDGVHGILTVAEGVTQSGIDVATKLSLEATGMAMKARKKSSMMSIPDEEEEDVKDEESLMKAFGAAMIDDDDDDDDSNGIVNAESRIMNSEEKTEVYV